LLQHAWAEMEHDIQYKSATVIPTAIRRKFISLAGMLEIADREFQGIQDEDERLTQRARASVRVGDLAEVEITPDSLKAYLDSKMGTDGRMQQWAYNFTAEILRKVGFETLSQLDECIRDYDDDRVSRAIWGYRQGQLSRFEDVLLASMGEIFAARHPLSSEEWWGERWRGRLERLARAGIAVGSFDPRARGSSG
jgi:putative GTP pyrophosphokinase